MLANATPKLARFAAAVILLASHAAAAEKLTIERLFAAPDLGGATLRAPRFSPDGRYVAYLQGSSANKDRLDLWAYDTRRGRNVLLIDASELVPQERALSAEEEARRERQRSSSLSGIVEYEFSPDGRHILVPLSGDLYLYDLGAAAGRAVRRLTATEAYETDAHFSPLGRHVSFLRAQNLFAIELASGRELAITDAGGGSVSFGSAEFIAQEEMNRDRGYWWSPDERYIVYARVDEAPVDEIERFEIYADSAGARP
jgi:dipeptidyl-peptidase-4